MPGIEIGSRIMIFLSEDDRAGHRGLHEELLARAREDGMAGATVWRGVEGFGASGHIRTARFPDGNVGLPLAVEVIDRPERIEAFLPAVIKLAPSSFITKEQVQMSRSGTLPAPALDDLAPRGSHREKA